MMVSSSNSSSGYKSRKKNENTNLKRLMHSNIHSSTIFNSQDMEQPKCPLTDEQMNKMWFTHTMENYPSIEKNAILPFAAIWMDLKNITLSEVISFICAISKTIQMDFPGGPVAKTPCYQCMGPGFDPWSGNQIPHATLRPSAAK